jgi:hypothetical protein
MPSDGYISLSPSRFISTEDMKQILTLRSITNIFSHSSNPFICGVQILLGVMKHGMRQELLCNEAGAKNVTPQ